MAMSDPFRETKGFATAYTYPEAAMPVMEESILKVKRRM
jgi:hypothetical protein